MTLAEQGPAGKATELAKSGGEKDYGRSIRAGARGYVSGILDQFQFVDTIIIAVRRGLTRAFHEGLKQAGVKAADLETPAYLPERLALDKLISENMASVLNFSAYVEERKKKYYDQGKKQVALNQVFNRSLLWSNQYDKARVTAFTMASDDKPMIWALGPTEHCTSCATFENRVYRASIWAKYNALPKSSRLCCTGRQCQCTLTETKLPITRGRFPEGALCF